MFSSLVRFILLIVCALISVVGAYIGFWPIFVITFIASFALLWGYYKAGTVPLALARLRKNEYKETEKLIDQIQKPQYLSKRNKAYFYFINGMLTRENDQFKESKPFLEQAMDSGKLKEPDKAMALLALADMELVQKHTSAARQYFLQMKGMKVHPAMMDAIRKMQAWLDI